MLGRDVETIGGGVEEYGATGGYASESGERFSSWVWTSVILLEGRLSGEERKHATRLINGAPWTPRPQKNRHASCPSPCRVPPGRH